MEIPEAGAKAKGSAEEESKTLKEEVRRLKEELEANKKGTSLLAGKLLLLGLCGKNDETHTE